MFVKFDFFVYLLTIMIDKTTNHINITMVQLLDDIFRFASQVNYFIFWKKVQVTLRMELDLLNG